MRLARKSNENNPRYVNEGNFSISCRVLSLCTKTAKENLTL